LVGRNELPGRRKVSEGSAADKRLTEMQGLVMGVEEIERVAERAEREWKLRGALEEEARKWAKLKWVRERPDGPDSEEVKKAAWEWARAVRKVEVWSG
jgi:hypothetical protein